jgi:hypothetical protein
MLKNMKHGHVQDHQEIVLLQTKKNVFVLMEKVHVKEFMIYKNVNLMK